MREHIIAILMAFYVDTKAKKHYNNRWDTWLITKNYMDEYFFMLLKSTKDVTEIVNEAKRRANEIRNTPLAKALEEDR